MSKASLAMQNLAQKLFSIEAGDANANHPEVDAVVKVCDKLQVSLTKFAGPVGYSSLLSRALTLAKAELPALNQVHIAADGRVDGLQDVERNPLPSAKESRETAGITIVAHLLGLLVTLIGEPFMVTLLSDAWPSESFDSVDQKSR